MCRQIFIYGDSSCCKMCSACIKKEGGVTFRLHSHDLCKRETIGEKFHTFCNTKKSGHFLILFVEKNASRLFTSICYTR